MPANLPLEPNSLPIQGPDPTGQLGYPLAVVGAPGGQPVVTTASGPSAVTIADGADVAEGSTLDAPVTVGIGTVNAHLRGIATQIGDYTDAGETTGIAGTVNAHLRGLTTILGAVWDSVNSRLRVGVADGADVAEGVTTGAAITTDIAGTIHDYIRGLVKILGNVWDSANSRLNVHVKPTVVPSSTFTSDPDTLLPCAIQAWDQNIPCYRPVRSTNDPNGLDGVGAANLNGVRVVGHLRTATNTWQEPRTVDGGDTSTGAGILGAGPLLWTGAAFSKLRTPATFKTVQAVAAGNTALWTPAAGKKFRLMRYMVEVTGNASIAGAGAVVTLTLFDAAAGATGQAHDVFVPLVALAGIGLLTTGWIDLDNGYLSVAANNVLNINLSAALVTGNARVICCGTEE